ncbi:helix-turn-helix transcriptional regulator [Rhizohabitans arisaemae]|uniref:helix-turn-helix transcriptional regulator n=1 Tax=Rhizohabitans arisaemae TaxID=2720610 RepID=UPI0024B0F3B5|nr:YafY family protein [Rhizohabitans arisaemae]
MNRTDRLYAIVEELRAISPRRRTARQLADRYAVSVRTIERDISALQQSGVPIYSEIGRTGGYALDRSMSLPPVNFTATEAVAIAVALGGSDAQPYAVEARRALHKVLGAMPVQAADEARALAGRVRFLKRPRPEPSPPARPGGIRRIVETAVGRREVLSLHYDDRGGTRTVREVEPAALVGGTTGWFLVGWCRLRAAARVFRLDRIADAAVTGERSPARPDELFACSVPDFMVHPVAID